MVGPQKGGDGSGRCQRMRISARGRALVFWHFLRLHWGWSGAGLGPGGRSWLVAQPGSGRPGPHGARREGEAGPGSGRGRVAGSGARPGEGGIPSVWAGRDPAMLITARWANEDFPAGAGPSGCQALALRTLLSEPALGTPGRLSAASVVEAVNSTPPCPLPYITDLPLPGALRTSQGSPHPRPDSFPPSQQLAACGKD